ncbi:putative peptidase family-domain-containing protein [Dipodascopsis uninucleata]
MVGPVYSFRSEDTPSPAPPPIPLHTRIFNGSHSRFAPKLLNIHENSTFYQRIVLIHGSAGPQSGSFDGTVTVYHHMSEFPPQTFSVCDGYFKSLVHLSPGRNDLKFVLNASAVTEGLTATTSISVNYIPCLQNAPLHLAVIVGKDSELIFDSPKYKREQEGNGLDIAIKKLRMAGYLWQAFTGEQMYRGGMGRRSFRLEEEWTVDTLSNRDPSLRTTAKVHVIRSTRTVKEIRNPDIAQQNPSATKKGDLFSIALDAIREYGGPFTSNPLGQETHVAALFLDTQWDPNMRLIRGHAALGGGSGHIKLGIFGSHTIHAWPKCIEEISSCFMDTTKLDLKEVANDGGDPGLSFQAVNVGIGAFMHEVGHLLGCPHEPSGVMLRGYTILNRSFMTKEPKLTGHQSPRTCLPNDECFWHRLDLLRFRCHPMFRLPLEPITRPSKPVIYPVENGAIVKSLTGIFLIEIHCEGQCRAHLEYPDGPQTEVFLFEDDLRQLLPYEYRRSTPIKLEILSLGSQQTTVNRFEEDLRNSSTPLGSGSLFDSLITNPDTSPSASSIRVLFRRITKFKIYHGSAVDGLEIFYDSGSAMFGNRGGSISEFNFELSEKLIGLHVRVGAWIDCVQIITNIRRSALYGNITGGEPMDLIPPPGYTIAGIHGYVQQWLTRIGITYSSDLHTF